MEGFIAGHQVRGLANLLKPELNIQAGLFGYAMRKVPDPYLGKPVCTGLKASVTIENCYGVKWEYG